MSASAAVDFQRPQARCYFLSMKVFTLIGLGAALLGCTCLYLASAHQRWRATPWPARPARCAGAVLLVLGWLGLLQDMHRTTASFTYLTLLMLVFTVLPYLGALRSARQGAAK